MNNGEMKHNFLSVIAKNAIELSSIYELPLYPEVYNVCYTYASGEDNNINIYIDNLKRKGRPITLYDISHLNESILSKKNKEKRESIESMHSIINRELSEILNKINTHLNKSYLMSSTERAKEDSNYDSSNIESLRNKIDLLISENRQMRNNFAKLNGELTSSYKHMEELRLELNLARENELTDPLTKVGNRRKFDQVLKHEIEKANENGQPLCLVLADLDKFKQINDRFGHQIGDQVLKYFAGLALRNSRESDLVARYGGEEFAIIFVGEAVGNVRQRIEKLREETEKARLVVRESGELIGKITASFGVAEWKGSYRAEDLVREADKHLYMAKSEGRNRIVA